MRVMRAQNPVSSVCRLQRLRLAPSLTFHPRQVQSGPPETSDRRPLLHPSRRPSLQESTEPAARIRQWRLRPILAIHRRLAPG
jgi:hypothetical protein